MRRHLANSLLVLGALCLAAVAVVQLEGRWLAVLERPQTWAADGSGSAEPPEPGATVAWIRLPRLGISALVREGVETGVLRASVGHLPRTALPGAAGNVVLAAHRDSFFRPLEEVRVGDDVWLVAPSGNFRYRVISTAVVGPRRTDLLRGSEESLLTLVTCYPFRYLGRAPQRFVVQALLEPASQLG